MFFSLRLIAGSYYFKLIWYPSYQVPEPSSWSNNRYIAIDTSLRSGVSCPVLSTSTVWPETDDNCDRSKKYWKTWKKPLKTSLKDFIFKKLQAFNQQLDSNYFRDISRDFAYWQNMKKTLMSWRFSKKSGQKVC